MKRGTNIFAVIGFIATFLVIATVAHFVSQNVTSVLFGNRQSAVSPTPTDVWCTRTTPYAMPPEFQRALSIISQRVTQSAQASRYYTPSDPKKRFYNCLDIQYADLSNQQAEGFFLFDTNSSPNDLKILVDNSYQEYDDYLTAILLSHEVTHAYQFLQQHFEGKYMSCYDKEIQAFETEKNFIAELNSEEKMSLIQRIVPNPNKNIAYEGIYQFLLIGQEAVQECSTNTGECYNQSVDRQITNMVEQNPFYQKQCGGNQ